MLYDVLAVTHNSIIDEEPLPNPPRKRGGCHRRVGFFYYGYLLGHHIIYNSKK